MARRKGRPRLRRMSSKKQNAFMWSQHPKIARRFVDRMKRTKGKHPVRGLPRYSQSRAARAARRRKK